MVANALAEGHTDERGFVELKTGPAYGLLVLVARGGQTTDPWLDAGESGGDEGEFAVIDLDRELISVLVDFFPGGPQPREAVITPFTTLATELGEHRLAHPLKEQTYMEAMGRAYDLLGVHLGGINLSNGPVPAADQPLLTLDTRARHALALHALSSLAWRIARASNVSSRSLHTLDLLGALLEDAGDDRARLDGIGQEGTVTVGICPAPEDCSMADDSCRVACALGPNTLRADLASALAFDFLPSTRNLTSLSIEDVRPLVEHLQASADRELFGGEPGAPLDSPDPIVEVRSSPVIDERKDTIAFGPGAEPLHTPGEGAEIDLGRTDICPTVGKHLHRLDHPGDNPLRWEVSVSDRSGWAGTGEIATSLEYRVRFRDPDAAQPGTCDAAAADPAWLTDWLEAAPIGSVAGGTVYEVVLLGDRVPELTTEPQGKFEIVFRGIDAIGQESIACRCWNHVPLPPPIEVSELVRATGAGSLDARNLHPGNNLAPLLNGVPVDQGAVLASFELRNGTDAGLYVSLAVEQPLTYYTKCWRRTNLPLSAEEEDLPCIIEDRCISNFPPDRQSTEVVDTGVIEDLIGDMRILDVTEQPPVQVLPCQGCAPTQYRVEPRSPSSQPRTYRVELLVTDLGALAPRSVGDRFEISEDVALESPVAEAVTITGVVYDDDAYICARNNILDPSLCDKAGIYHSYRAVTAADLIMAEMMTVHAAMSVTTSESLQALESVSVGLEAYEWNTYETELPNCNPNCEESVTCPIRPVEED